MHKNIQKREKFFIIFEKKLLSMQLLAAEKPKICLALSEIPSLCKKL